MTQDERYIRIFTADWEYIDNIFYVQIIDTILSNIDYIRELHGPLRDTVVGVCVQSLEYGHGESLLLGDKDKSRLIVQWPNPFAPWQP
jgi:hypothetical protein